MRHLIPSLIVLASLVLTNEGVGGQITFRSAEKLNVARLATLSSLDGSPKVMRPKEIKAALVNRSSEPTLLRGNSAGLRPSQRPVRRLPRVETEVRLPVSSSRLIKSAVPSPASARSYSPMGLVKPQHSR